MHIKTLTVIGILLSGVAACGNNEPADPIVTPPSPQATRVPDTAMPTNDMLLPSDTTNSLEPSATPANSVAPPADEPRGNPDRR